MLIYAIIPARGGSKGIPNKNLSKVDGRSLVEIGIDVCMNAKEVDKVFVSTNSQDIILEAKKFGADTIVRPDDISGDTSSSEEAILHAIDEIQNRGLVKPDVILFYQVTNALTTSKDIDDAYGHFIQSNADSLFTASLFTGCLWERNENGKMSPINHDYTKRQLRQEVSNCFSENGAFYLFNTDGFVKNKHRFFGKIEMFEMNSLSKYDIDEPHDLKIADLLMKEYL